MKNTAKKDFRKAVLIIALSFSAVSGIVVWLRNTQTALNAAEILMMAGTVLVVGFALFLAFRRIRDARADLPAEDELSKRLMQKAAGTSFYVSLYLWLALMMFEARIPLERSTLIGAGILGMAILFALSWIFHRYLRSGHE
jgi:uncharacterized membrane-anchored protein